MLDRLTLVAITVAAFSACSVVDAVKPKEKPPAPTEVIDTLSRPGVFFTSGGAADTLSVYNQGVCRIGICSVNPFYIISSALPTAENCSNALFVREVKEERHRAAGKEWRYVLATGAPVEGNWSSEDPTLVTVRSQPDANTLGATAVCGTGLRYGKTFLQVEYKGATAVVCATIVASVPFGSCYTTVPH